MAIEVARANDYDALPMAFDFPSPEWTAAYKDAINQNESYKKSGKDWTHGVVAYVVKAEPDLGIPEDTAMLMDLHGGECREAKLVTGAEAQSAPFVIVASYAQWKQVIKREIDPTKALMQGKLKLTKGHMPTMVKYVHASKDLVESTAKVPTKFRGE
ncbi:MAG: Fis family transcriptional regulator [Polyangiaceae bacterium]|nr:Fis family transcriptional regulator [Polyangiaceae bacterium]